MKSDDILSPEPKISYRPIFSDTRIDSYILYSYDCRKAEKSPTGATAAPPWWGDVQQLRYLLKGAWDQISQEFVQDILKAFENRDEKAIEALLERLDPLGLQMSEAIKDPAEAICTNLHNKALAAWMEHGQTVLQIRNLAKYPEDYKDALAQAWAQQIKNFTREHPRRIIHPEIMRQLEHLRSAELTTVTDVMNLKDRLNRFLKREVYWENLSAAQIARQWHADGILLAHANGVDIGQVSGPEDKAKCKVCWRMLGTHVHIKYMAEKIIRDINIEDPDEYIKAWRFPRLDDVKDLPAEEIERQGYFPPFHCRCRDTVLWLVKRGVKPLPAPIKPKPTKPALTAEKPKAKPAGSLEEVKQFTKEKLVYPSADKKPPRYKVDPDDPNSPWANIRRPTRSEIIEIRKNFLKMPRALRQYIDPDCKALDIWVSDDAWPHCNAGKGYMVLPTTKSHAAGYNFSKESHRLKVNLHEMNHGFVSPEIMKKKGGPGRLYGFLDRQGVRRFSHCNSYQRLSSDLRKKMHVDEWLTMMSETYKPGMTVAEQAGRLRKTKWLVETTPGNWGHAEINPRAGLDYMSQQDAEKAVRTWRRILGIP